MKKILITLSLLLGAGFHALALSDYQELYKDLPFEMPVISRPDFSQRSVSVVDYGAVGDGATLNTEAFNKAMKELSALGGGTLEVPAGVWLTGPIEFCSGINLHLERGAIISFSTDKNLYPLKSVAYEGFEGYRCTSPIYGENLTDVAITGQGIIDGNGDAWRYVRRNKTNGDQWKRLLAQGGLVDNDTWYPSEEYRRGMDQRNGLGNQSAISCEDALAIKDFFRPNMVKFVNCRNLLLEGVLFQNSPAWTLHPLMCENVIIDNVYVKNPVYSQNTDAMDIESCRNVIITRTTLDVGDDAICIKSGKDLVGRKRAKPTENVIVSGCRVFEGHGGFVVGSEMSGGVRNIRVTDCEFAGTDVGLRFKSNRGRGGIVENIYIDNINMLNISNEALLFDLYYSANGGPKTDVAEVNEGTPCFRNININGVTSAASGIPVKFNGLPEMPIENITISNSSMTSRQGGLLAESKHIRFDNVSISVTEGPALIVRNVSDASLTNCRFNSPSGDAVTFEGTNTEVEM